MFAEGRSIEIRSTVASGEAPTAVNHPRLLGPWNEAANEARDNIVLALSLSCPHENPLEASLPVADLQKNALELSIIFATLPETDIQISLSYYFPDFLGKQESVISNLNN